MARGAGTNSSNLDYNYGQSLVPLGLTDVVAISAGGYPRGGDCATATITVVVSPAGTNAFAAQISLASDTRWPTISFPTVTGQFYQVQYRDGLAAGPWSILATNLAGSGDALSVTDTNPVARRFYRVGAWLH